MPETDVLSPATMAVLREIREELRTIELRSNQREAAFNSTIQTLTRQLVQMDSEVADRLAKIEKLLADIARKLDA